MNDNKNAPFRAVVFDFDGTLAELHIDFGEMKRRVAAVAAGYLPHAPSPNHLPALEWIEVLLADIVRAGHPEGGGFRLECEEAIIEMEIEAARRAVLFPFTMPMLAELKERTIQTAVITRNTERAVRIVCPDIDEVCGCFLAREHVDKVKPEPEHLLTALDRLGVDPAGTLMIGDHPLDVETGRRAGVTAAGVWTGRATREDLIASGARWVAPDCGALIEQLTREGLLTKEPASAG